MSAGGHVRWRSEAWRNFALDEENDDAFDLLRVFAHTDWRFGNHVRVFVEGRIPFGSYLLTVRGGRQELSFGRERLLSPLDWVNNRRIFDGARLTLAAPDGRWSVDGFWVRPVTLRKYAFNRPDTERDLIGLYGSTELGSEVSLEGYLLSLRADRPSGSTAGGSTRHTAGGRLAANVGRSVALDAESAVQWGQEGGRPIRAWMATLEPTYSWAVSGRPWLTLGFDYASGDEDPLDDRAGTFDQLFPLGHVYFGYIDAIGRQNIIDTAGTLGFWPVRDRVSVKVDLHWFRLADPDDAVYDAGGRTVQPGRSGSTDVGRELDLTVVWRTERRTTVSGGFSRLSPGTVLGRTGSGAAITFLYTQVRYDF